MSERPPISPRSPRAALEPEQVPPPPKRSDRARNPLVIAGNAIITIILVAMIGTGGVYVYGSYPDLDELFQQQAAELDLKKREGQLLQSAGSGRFTAPMKFRRAMNVHAGRITQAMPAR